MRTKQIISALAVNILQIALIVILVIAVYRGATKAYDFGYHVFAEEAAEIEPGRDFEVTVVQGKSVKDVADMLEEYGLIKSAEIYQIREWFSPEHGDMQPGVYVLNSSMYPSEMITILSGTNDETTE